MEAEGYNAGVGLGPARSAGRFRKAALRGALRTIFAMNFNEMCEALGLAKALANGYGNRQRAAS